MNRPSFPPRLAGAISANVRVAIILACVAGAFYSAMIIDHLPS